MQEVAAAVTIRRAHNLAGNGSLQRRPRHLERPKNFRLLIKRLLCVKKSADRTGKVQIRGAGILIQLDE